MKVKIGPYRDAQIRNGRHKHKKRKICVRIDNYDTWNMDETLAYIIHPMLIQLKETKHGAPHVDDEDVPYELSSEAAPSIQEIGDVDRNHFKRWDWVLDEMIWSFEQLLKDWQEQYHSGDTDIVWKPVDSKGNPVKEEDAKLFEMTKGPNDTHVFDVEGYKKHNERMRNGFILFGKYFQSLWD